MVERQLAEVDDATFPLASARLIGGTFHLSGTVESRGRATYRGLLVRLPIELSVTEVVSCNVEDTSGTGALILKSADSFDGGLNLVGVIPCTVTVATMEHSQLRLQEGTRPVAFRRWWRWQQLTEDPLSTRNALITSEGLDRVQPVSPIFVANDEDDDLDVAPSVAWAVEGMEPPEVSAGHFLVFDATGRQGYLQIDRFDIVIERWDPAADVLGLRSRIDRCLRLHSIVVEKGLDDSDYVQEAARLIFNETRKNQWPKWPRWLRKKMHGDQELPIFPSAAP